MFRDKIPMSRTKCHGARRGKERNKAWVELVWFSQSKNQEASGNRQRVKSKAKFY